MKQWALSNGGSTMEEIVQMHCQKCGKDLGYAEYKKNAYPVTCRGCLRSNTTRNRKQAWDILSRHFAGNSTYGITHDKAVVAAACVIGSGWAGETFVMVSGGRKMVRYWHRASPDNPATRR